MLNGLLLLAVSYIRAQSNRQSSKRRNLGAVTLLSQFGLLLLYSCKCAHSASIAGGTMVSGSTSKGEESQGSQSRISDDSLLRQLLCSMGGCCNDCDDDGDSAADDLHRQERDIKFTAMMDAAQVTATSRDKTQRWEGQIISQIKFRRWWPRRLSRGSRVNAVITNSRRLWTIWKRNTTLMFGIAVPGTNTYYYLTKGRKGNRLCLSRPRPAQSIGDAADNRYFHLIISSVRESSVLQHINTGLYVGLTSGRTPRLRLTNLQNAEDWDVRFSK